MDLGQEADANKLLNENQLHLPWRVIVKYNFYLKLLTKWQLKKLTDINLEYEKGSKNKNKKLN